VGQNEGVIDLHSQLGNITFLLKSSTIIDYALGVMINQKYCTSNKCESNNGGTKILALAFLKHRRKLYL
jgi:hypothetical protein